MKSSEGMILAVMNLEISVRRSNQLNYGATDVETFFIYSIFTAIIIKK